MLKHTQSILLSTNKKSNEQPRVIVNDGVVREVPGQPPWKPKTSESRILLQNIGSDVLNGLILSETCRIKKCIDQPEGLDGH